jgi:hypothetical protein
MIAGCSGVTLREYQITEELYEVFEEFFGVH